MSKYQQAMAFAMKKHDGQTRKYTGEPYINHCAEVVSILEDYGHNDEDLKTAAILHDVVEDTDATFQDIKIMFGRKVCQLVFFVTNLVDKDQGNRKTRFELNILHIVSTPDIDPLLIKCADLISNTKSIVERDPDFAIVYLAEKRELLRLMAHRHSEITQYPIFNEACRLAGGNL